ncbi:hypothetical protein SO802_010258 [Lithocarpus litseifolius]|uniref:Uncharacterized protein n=1 Tax=Lithocarpus litseifolius TaxID=425828 RepID=A0AAW2DEC6_9ROSI
MMIWRGVSMVLGHFPDLFGVFGSTSAIRATFLLWLTIIEQLHLSCNIRGNPDCYTAKKSLIGGAASVSLDASLFWLVSIMLALNAKEDYFDDDTEEVPVKGGDDNAITIETNKIDVSDDMENFNGENHQIITIETDELVDSLTNVEFLDDVQDDISHSITTEADELETLLHNTQDDSQE